MANDLQLAGIDISIRSDVGAPSLSLDAPPAAALTNPAHAGFLFKLGVTYGCWPTWKKRYCIVKGGFLFKYSSPSSSKPKGTPIPITDCEIDACELPAAAAQAAAALDSSAGVGGELFGIRVSTLVHEYTFGCASADERRAWIAKLRSHKQISIKQQMGHAPITADERWAASSGQHLVTRKQERVQAQAAEELDVHGGRTMRSFVPM